jgi:hypothetical protein
MYSSTTIRATDELSVRFFTKNTAGRKQCNESNRGIRNRVRIHI